MVSIRILLGTSALSLLTGSVLYLAIRSQHLLMFHWAKFLGLGSTIKLMRSSDWWEWNILPQWAIYSLPYGLWLFSYMGITIAIWGTDKTWRKHFWLALGPIIAILSELAQSIKAIPGVFDWLDIYVLIGATIVGYLVLLFP